MIQTAMQLPHWYQQIPKLCKLMCTVHKVADSHDLTMLQFLLGAKVDCTTPIDSVTQIV